MRGLKLRMFSRPPCIGNSTHESSRFRLKRSVLRNRFDGTEFSEPAMTNVRSFDSFVVVTELRPFGAPAGLKLLLKLPRTETFWVFDMFQSTLRLALLFRGLNWRMTFASRSGRSGMAIVRTESSVACAMF